MPPRRRCRATSCYCRPPAPRLTSSAIMKRAATAFAISSRRSGGERGDGAYGQDRRTAGDCGDPQRQAARPAPSPLRPPAAGPVVLGNRPRPASARLAALRDRAGRGGRRIPCLGAEALDDDLPPRPPLLFL